ncbi:MAG: aspartate-semialdehyde dehydrogenase [Candidatus Auribacter fodinae]|jgi:aspartate-semialdehyde dehydrogenase|uniref:Aspartate-semialdehyde dehydrogenase n=1 Tax=Candidatus Auribacter fodinae TaxID=2093366 RepID=A0A3A4R0M2_9BACT|nr:MAG: aspartate-semialdehyde dehydrogenase [Candidatus Auribacter fodinae]
MSKTYSVAVVGATGAVGQEMMRTLERRNFPVGELRLLASERSAGKKAMFKGKEYTIQELKEDSFEGIQIALFSAGGSISKKFVPYAVKSGAVAIDNTSAFRMDPNVPLVVPEVNPSDIFKNKGIIANPNCSTIQMVQVLKPLHDFAKIKRVVVSTYQAVSGAGMKAMEELLKETEAVLQKKEYKRSIFPHQIAFNALPRIPQSGGIEEGGYTNEEVKMIKETKKIMGDNSIAVTATCVRVPVLRGHSESVNIETEKRVTVEKARELLAATENVIVQDDIEKELYPLAITSADKFETFVGRIREDDTVKYGLNLWVVSDNLLKGAAWNAVQIAEKLIAG